MLLPWRTWMNRYLFFHNYAACFIKYRWKILTKCFNSKTSSCYFSSRLKIAVDWVNQEIEHFDLVSELAALAKDFQRQQGNVWRKPQTWHCQRQQSCYILAEVGLYTLHTAALISNPGGWLPENPAVHRLVVVSWLANIQPAWREYLWDTAP